MKSEEEDLLSQYAQNDFLPINLTSLVVADWSNNKLQEIVRGAEVFKAMCWKGTATFKEGHVYTGSMRNGKMHGEGKFAWKDGTVYEGKFRKNEITGSGKYSWPDGTYYTGEVRDGIRNGKGTFVHPKEGYKYEGEWKDGLRHGKGILSYLIEGEDKDKFTGYEGTWKDGEKSGFGKYVYPSGNCYEGEWLHNKRSGKGTMYWEKIASKVTNEKYTGQWKDDLQSGFGTHIWLDEKSENKVLRNRYVGYWKNGTREGHGIFFYANGSMYTGQWKDNMKDGWGKFIYEDGSEFDGMYSKDRLIDKNIAEGAQKTLTAGIQAAPDMTAAQTLHKEIEKVAKAVPKPPAKGEKSKEQPKPAQPQKPKPEVESNPYSKMIDCADLIVLEQLLPPEKIRSPAKGSGSPTASTGGPFTGKPKEVQEELNNIMLIHNSELKHWYKYFCGVDRVEFEEGFMMVARQFWRLLSTCKVLHPGFSLAHYNRIYLKGKKTFFSLKYNPFYGSEGRKEEWRPTTTESDGMQGEGKAGGEAVRLLEAKKEDSIERSALTPVKPRESEALPGEIFDEAPIQHNNEEYDDSAIEEMELFEKEDVHDAMRPMLFRHFAEAIIRAAYLYYINDASESIKGKLNAFFTEKLKPNLPEVAKRGKKKEFDALKPSLAYLYEETLKPYEKILLSVFKLHSKQSKQKMDQFDDYTLSVKTLFDMVKTAFGEGLIKLEDFIKMIELSFDDTKTSKAIGITLEHIDNVMSYELIYYEYKGILLELIKHINKKKDEDIKEDHIKDFVIKWLGKLRRKETKIKVAQKRVWPNSEKDLAYNF